ncbi:MAG: 6-phosphogluconolactonase [Frankiaceae bacterium]|nr:6-phosphogluconolactonase [Frankiaceae bacterium]
MSAAEVIVHKDPAILARAAAARLVTRLVDVQSARSNASVVLTGGGIGTATLEEIRAIPARDAVDWSHVDIWWGDERFLATGDPERNETQARAALLDHVKVDPARVHPVPAAGDAHDPEAAAERYAAALQAAAQPEDHGLVPQFDVLLLGIGPDGHVASLFPESPAMYDERSVVGVHGAPKPPPNRVSLTLGAINSAREIWIVAAGADKARAVSLALGGAGSMQVPAAAVTGRRRTLWLLDTAAASKLPPGLNRLASP